MSLVKQKILEDVLKQQFEIERYRKFVREFFNEVEILPEKRHTGIWKEYKEHIESYYTVAKYEQNNENIIVLAVELKKNVSIDRARSIQRNFISKVLDTNNCDASIVAFYTDTEPSWRLSFVRLDYSITDKGLNLDLTPAKRYSYLVGENEPNHTALAQLLPIFNDDDNNPTLNEIENAFSIEKVTTEFFNKYRDKYLDLKEYLENHDTFISETNKLGFEIEKFSEQFAKKLMGQLAFLYFIQKKGWLGVRMMPENRILKADEFFEMYNNQDDTHKKMLEKIFKKTKDGLMKARIAELNAMDEHEAELLSDCFVGTSHEAKWGEGKRKFIREIFDFCIEKTNKNFFDDYLEPLFYDALNKKRKNHYFRTFNCKIPFLNGGLFEPLEGYHWKDVNFKIPDNIFSNEKEKGKEADGILDVFDRFNFTMNEDEPLEKEVAIDPEMLGKIFENLLDIKDRKSKGAFYTPREIVHYMCQESLINYLVNTVNVPYEDIKQFILYGELIKDEDSRANVGYGKDFKIKQTIFDKISEIDDALKSVKVADPAVGSGAFPLGMLNEIVRARNNITEYIIRKDKEGTFGKQYGKEFITKRRSPYKMKWDTIKDCIFAVDIEPSAVDIAKLRLWLSVIVDQDIDDETPEPHPLPNLDMNIHVGNSLIDEYEGIQLFDKNLLKNSNNKKQSNNLLEQMKILVDSDEMLKVLFERQSDYFEENDEAKKHELKKEIDQLKDELIIYKLNELGNKHALNKYNQIKSQRSKPYFIWELEFAKVFREKGGFDIVIGNPPYIGFHNVPNKEYYKNKYNSANGKYDFYVLFIEKGLQLIRDKGYISYICPSYFYKRNYGNRLRQLILNKTCIKFIADFNDSQIFESATTYTCIFGFEKSTQNEQNKIRVIDGNLNSNKYHEVLQDSLSEPVWMLNDSKEISVVNKIKEKAQCVFADIAISISQGIVTGNNDVFILNKELIDNCDMNYLFLKPVFKGKNIRNGKLIPSEEYIFYPYEIGEDNKNKLIDEEIIKTNNPHLYNYLFDQKTKLLSREYFTKSNKNWYELWNPRKMIHFYNRKFVFSEVNDKNDFVLCNDCFYSDSACGAELKDKFKQYESYIIRYLNSNTVCELYRKISVPKANGYLIYKNAFLKDLPIYIPEDIDFNYKNYINMSDSVFENWLISELEIDKYD